MQYACQPLLVALGYDQPDSSEEEEKNHDAEPQSSSTQELSLVSNTVGLGGSNQNDNNADTAASSDTGDREDRSAPEISVATSVTDTGVGTGGGVDRGAASRISTPSGPIAPTAGKQEGSTTGAATEFITNAGVSHSAAALRAAVEGGGTTVRFAG